MYRNNVFCVAPPPSPPPLFQAYIAAWALQLCFANMNLQPLLLFKNKFNPVIDWMQIQHGTAEYTSASFVASSK